DTLATVAQGGADAIGAGVAAADDNHIFPLGGDIASVGMVAVEQALGVGVQELHGEIDAVQLPSFGAGKEVVRFGCPAAENDGIVLVQEFVRGVVLADFATGDERNPFGAHQVDPALNNSLVQLHVRNAVLK